MPSIFSKILTGEIPCYKIAENDKFLSFLDIFPLVKGHTLVIPKIEIDYVFDLPDNYLSEVLLFSKQVASKIHKAFPEYQRIGISVIGLEVPHAHVHLVPINSADDINFTRPKIKLESQELESIRQKIVNS